MADLITCKKEDLVSIADKIRTLVGTSEGLSLGDMSSNTAAANEDIANIKTALADKGVEVSDDTKLADLAGIVEDIQVGDTSIEDALVQDVSRLVEYSNDRVTKIRANTFVAAYSLKTINLPLCTNIGANAFGSCQYLTNINIPLCKTIASSAFQNCNDLLSVPNDMFSNCTWIGASAFYDCELLSYVNFPKCTTLSPNAFEACSKLTTAIFPECTGVGNSAFKQCSSLTTISFPLASTIGTYAFRGCNNLTNINFPLCSSIGNSAFWWCSNLTTLILGNSSVCKLGGSVAFSSTPIKSGTGYIYVPSSLVDAYKTATNWTYFSNQISAIEDMA